MSTGKRWRSVTMVCLSIDLSIEMYRHLPDISERSGRCAPLGVLLCRNIALTRQADGASTDAQDTGIDIGYDVDEARDQKNYKGVT